MKKIFILVTAVLFSSMCFAQKLAIRSDREAVVKVDGKDLGRYQEEEVKVVAVSLGEYVIQAVTPDGLYKLEEVVYINDTTQEVHYLENWKAQSAKLLEMYFNGKTEAAVESRGGKAYLLKENGDIRSQHFYILNKKPVEILHSDILTINNREAVWVKCRHTEGWMYLDDIAFYTKK